MPHSPLPPDHTKPAAASPDAVARHYDVLDPYYRRLWGEHLHHGLWATGRESVEEATEAMVRLVADQARIGGGWRVVDIGSGYGATARFLARERGARVTAVTLSPAQHRHARSTPAVVPPVDYHLGDFAEAGLPSAAFDAAVAIESLSHVAELDRVLAEVVRVLRPGARFVACIWLSGDAVTPWGRRWVADPVVREGRLARLAPSAFYEDALRRAGLQVDDVQDRSREVRRTWWVCLRRVASRLLADGEARAFVARGGEGIFAWTVPRLWAAYRLGILRYGVFTARKPSA